MIDFKKYGGKQRLVDVADPLKLFESLDVKATHTTLRPAQIEALQGLTAKRSERDVVLKMNTGAGKTTVALLYLRSHAAEKKRPAVYLCPTTQLVAQVLDEAGRLGIAAIDYPAGKPHPDATGMSGEAIIVCTYEKLFNAKTTFDRTDVRLSPCAIVMDDAHAGVERIRDAFAVRVSNDVRARIVELLAPAMKAYKPGVWADVERGDATATEEVPYWIWRPLVDTIRKMLSEQAETDLKFVWPIVRDELEWFRCIVSGTALEIVPDVAHVERVRAYNDCTHRLFTSATLADDSVLVRELACSADAALAPVQPASDQGVGERMVLAPSLIDPSLDRLWVMTWAEALAKWTNVVVLAASTRAAEEWANHGAAVVVGDKVDGAVRDLRSGIPRFVAFAQRYDGIDLPDDACRVLILDGMPYGESLAARYDADMPGRPGAAHNRLVHRIEQGMGRAVRSHADYAVVILAGPEIASFVARLDILDLFNPSTRAQIEFVHDLTEIAVREKPDAPEVAAHDLLLACLGRNESWKDIYDEKVRGTLTPGPSISARAIALASLERAAAVLASRRDAEGAAQQIENALSNAQGDREKGWYLQLAAKYRFAADPARSLQSQVAAHNANDRMFPPPAGAALRPDKADRADAPVAILHWYGGFNNANGAIAQFQNIRTRLGFDVSPDTMEGGLKDLATLLGADGSRPEKVFNRGPDGLWLWVDASLVIEAKNDARYARLPKRDSGQLHDSMQWFSENHPTRTATPVLVARTAETEQDAHFPPETRVLTPEGLAKLLENVEHFLAELVTKPAAQWRANEIGQLLARHKLGASQFLGKYTTTIK